MSMLHCSSCHKYVASKRRFLIILYFSLVLQEAREDEKAFHCKIVCLLQLGRFDEALNHIHKNIKIAEYVFHFPLFGEVIKTTGH